MDMKQPNVQLDKEQLEEACIAITSIPALVDGAMKLIAPWLKANGDLFNNQGVIKAHADRLRGHAAAMVQTMAQLDRFGGTHYLVGVDPSIGKLPEGNGMVETETAYGNERLARLSAGDVRNAIEFDTELKDTFGLAFVDEELREPLLQALECLQIEIEDGSATMPGIAVKVLKAFLKAYPRASARYYSGTDTWPRPSAVIQAEIDYRMPDALEWLRYELNEALRQEASLKASG